MEIVNDLSEIDQLDQGKQWKQLDNWMKQKKIKEYATKYQLDQSNLISLFHKGEFRKTAQVSYDANLGEITNLHSKLL